MSNILIIGANSPMVSEFILTVNENLSNKLFLLVRDKEKFMKKNESKLDFSRIQLFSCDLEDDSVFSVLSQIDDKFDSFCYVSGSTNISLIKFIKRESFNKVFEVNFNKPLFITQFLLKKKMLNNSSNVVYISSISGEGKVAPGIASYSTSKAALNNLVKVLAIENSNLKIKFNTICPGVVNTEFNDVVDNLKSDKGNLLENRYPLGFGNPNDIASLIKYFLIENTWVSGQNIVIDGGFSIN